MQVFHFGDIIMNYTAFALEINENKVSPGKLLKLHSLFHIFGAKKHTVAHNISR